MAKGMRQIAAVLPEPVRGIGDNNPPEATPFELSDKAIQDLRGEANLWLDGADVANQDQADGIANLIRLFRAEAERADLARKKINEPWRTLIRENDDAWKPLGLACDCAIDVLKRALLPWSQKLRDEQAMIKKAAYEAAALAQEKKCLALLAANPVVLADMEAVQEANQEVMDSQIAVSEAQNLRPVSGNEGMPGRRVGIRQKPVPVIVDRKAAMTHYWMTRKDDVVAFLLTLANEDVRLKRHVREPIPGVRVDMIDTIV